jgi:hypothetical protein
MGKIGQDRFFQRVRGVFVKLRERGAAGPRLGHIRKVAEKSSSPSFSMTAGKAQLCVFKTRAPPSPLAGEGVIAKQ